MAFVIATGAGEPDANSPNSLAELRAYHAERGNLLPGSAMDGTATDAELTAAALYATSYMIAKWEPLLPGRRTLFVTQAHPWPRYWARSQSGQWIQSNVIPMQWKAAHAELTLFALLGPLAPTIAAGGMPVSTTLGGPGGQLTTTYRPGSDPRPVYDQALVEVTPLFRYTGGQFQ